MRIIKYLFSTASSTLFATLILASMLSNVAAASPALAANRQIHAPDPAVHVSATLAQFTACYRTSPGAVDAKIEINVHVVAPFSQIQPTNVHGWLQPPAPQGIWYLVHKSKVMHKDRKWSGTWRFAYAHPFNLPESLSSNTLRWRKFPIVIVIRGRYYYARYPLVTVHERQCKPAPPLPHENVAGISFSGERLLKCIPYGSGAVWLEEAVYSGDTALFQQVKPTNYNSKSGWVGAPTPSKTWFMKQLTFGGSLGAPPWSDTWTLEFSHSVPLSTSQPSYTVTSAQFPIVLTIHGRHYNIHYKPFTVNWAQCQPGHRMALNPPPLPSASHSKWADSPAHVNIVNQVSGMCGLMGYSDVNPTIGVVVDAVGKSANGAVPGLGKGGASVTPVSAASWFISPWDSSGHSDGSHWTEKLDIEFSNILPISPVQPSYTVTPKQFPIVLLIGSHEYRIDYRPFTVNWSQCY